MLVAVHYAEIGLKGRNRPQFERALRQNLARALAPLGAARVTPLYGRILVELPDSVPLEAAIERLREVFGVAYFSRVTRAEPTREAIHTLVEERIAAGAFETFGVRTRRVDKRLPWTSSELDRELGAHIVARTGKRVNLTNPDLWVELHLLHDRALLLWEKIAGPGGLPVGSSGRAMSLISGGIDSPVASHRMLKRGLDLGYVHFHSAPYTSAASQEKVRDIVARLARFQGPARLYLVPFGELQMQLVREAPAEPRIVLYRRFMLRIAEEIARRERADAIVTGECLGQVSSQTLGNLDTINRAATLPVLRPLIGMDKAEIIALAQREVGTFQISIEPEEDCCSYLMPRRPATWTRPEPIEAIEATLDVKGMVNATLDRVQRERIDPIP